jgi:hypothetical protein
MPEPYKYRSLSSELCIRVVALAPAISRGCPIRCELIEIDLNAAVLTRPAYEALSYAWGTPKGDRPILCEGQEILVTKTCEAALRQFRFRFRRRLMWDRCDMLIFPSNRNLRF